MKYCCVVGVNVCCGEYVVKLIVCWICDYVFDIVLNKIDGGGEEGCDGVYKCYY